MPLLGFFSLLVSPRGPGSYNYFPLQYSVQLTDTLKGERL